MKLKGVIIFLVCFTAIAIAGAISLENAGYSTTEFLVKDSETFAVDASKLRPSEIASLRSSLNELKYSREIDFEEKSNSSFIIKFNDANTKKVSITDGKVLIEEVSTSYIVEFKSMPIVKKEKALEKEIESLREQSTALRKSNKVSKSLSLEAKANKKELQKAATIENYNQELTSEHANALADIKKELGGSSATSRVIDDLKRFTGNIVSKITGAEISGISALTPEKEFYTIFNGAVLNLSAEDVEKAAKSKYLKKIYPNRKVKAVLMNSIPLIGADAVWEEPDDDGLNITGEGVSIAVIDTGIDYTHPDLGGCTKETFLTEKCTKVAGGYDFVNEDNDPMDDHGHGTHVASTAAGRKGDTTSISENLIENPTESLFKFKADEGQAITLLTKTDASLPIEDLSFKLLYGNGTAFLGTGGSENEKLATSSTSILVFNASAGDESLIVSWNSKNITKSWILHPKISGTGYGKKVSLIDGKGKECNATEKQICKFAEGKLTITKIEISEDKKATITFKVNEGGSFNRFFDIYRNYIILPQKEEFSSKENTINVYNSSGVIIETHIFRWSNNEISEISSGSGSSSGGSDGGGGGGNIAGDEGSSSANNRCSELTDDFKEKIDLYKEKSNQMMVLQEGAEIKINDYAVIYSPNIAAKARIIQVNGLPGGSLDAKNSRIYLKDALTGEQVFDSGLIVGINGEAAANINEYRFYFKVNNKTESSTSLKITWGEGASFGIVGNEKDSLECSQLSADFRGLNGVAPGAKIYAYKVLNSDGSGNWENIIAAIERAVDPNQDRDTSDHLDIISMSLGGRGDPDDPISKAVDNAADAGVLSVIAAGNDGPYTQSVGSPGTSRKALTVGATYKKNYLGQYWNNYDPKVDNLTSFSSRGPVIWGNGVINKPDVVAPGALICAARYDSIFPEGAHRYYKPCLDDKHVQLAGTSMATPIVAGLAALIKQKYPQMTPEEIKSLIKLTAKDFENKIYAQGTGRVDAKEALEAQFIATGELDFGISTPGKPLSAQKNISFKNIGAQEIILSIKVENALEFKGNAEFNPIQLGETEVTLAPGEKKELAVNLKLSVDSPEGVFLGKIIANDGKRDYIIPYSFGKLSELKLTLEGKHYPRFRAIGQDMNVVYGANQGWTFNGNSATLQVKSGTYTVFAINVFVNPKWPFSDSEEYYIMDMVDVPMNGNAEKMLKLGDAKKFVVKARAKNNEELNLYEWYKGLSVYINKTYGCSYLPKEDCQANIDCIMDESGYCYNKIFSLRAFDSNERKGDRNVWISEKPDNGLHIDMVLRYLGVPNA